MDYDDNRSECIRIDEYINYPNALASTEKEIVGTVY